MMMAHITSGRDGYKNKNAPSRDRSPSCSRMAHSSSGRIGYEDASPPRMRMAHVSSGRVGFATNNKSHNGICCDVCETQDFEGVRYKCSTCPDFDVCQRCIEEVEDKELHPHTFLRIATPHTVAYAHMAGAVPLLANRSRWVHKDVMCAHCDPSHPDKLARQIIGYRFFCTICGISLCEHCEQTSGHNVNHPLLKMVPPTTLESSARK